MAQHQQYDDDDDPSVVAAGVNMNYVEKIMAEEIEQLSIHDRNAIYEEVHGVSTMAIEETPELLEDSLRSLQEELDKIDRESRSSYDCIANQKQDCPSKRIIEDRAFRLRFLRCAFFNPLEAANRMINFFDVLHKLYGQEALKRFDATMDFFVGSEIGGGDKIAFRSGYFQLLPFRDRSGRKILVLVMDALEIEDKTRLKIFLYMAWVAGDDAESQRNGVVLLFWPGFKDMRHQLPPVGHRKMVTSAIRGMPTRFASFHICFLPTPFFRVARLMLSMVLKPVGIIRVKIHTGERMELQYQLMGYGIPVNLIPTTGTGTLKTKVFAQWAKSRKLLESCRTMDYPENSLWMECPGVRDVIFRSAGKSCMLNPGNVAFRGIFEQYHNEHVQAGQTEKKNLVWKIVEEIESREGRFLVWDKRGWWVPLVDRTEIRNKVAISLRGYNKQRKADDNRQYFKSSTHAFEGQDGKRIKCMSSGEESDDSRPCEGCLPL